MKRHLPGFIQSAHTALSLRATNSCLLNIFQSWQYNEQHLKNIFSQIKEIYRNGTDIFLADLIHGRKLASR